MANPSTIWAQLSIPNPPVGSVPFVATDGITIVTDVTNFWYDQTNFRLNLAKQPVLGYAASTTPGTSLTQNSPSGRFQLQSGSTTFTLTNNCVTANSIIHVVMESQDATANYIVRVASSAPGSFFVVVNAAATSTVKFAYTITN